MTLAVTKYATRRRLFAGARILLIGAASLYAVAVICVMTPVIQTQFGFPLSFVILTDESIVGLVETGIASYMRII